MLLRKSACSLACLFAVVALIANGQSNLPPDHTFRLLATTNAAVKTSFSASALNLPPELDPTIRQAARLNCIPDQLLTPNHVGIHFDASVASPHLTDAQ
jgi:hypothetical protein